MHTLNPDAFFCKDCQASIKENLEEICKLKYQELFTTIRIHDNHESRDCQSCGRLLEIICTYQLFKLQNNNGENVMKVFCPQCTSNFLCVSCGLGRGNSIKTNGSIGFSICMDCHNKKFSHGNDSPHDHKFCLDRLIKEKEIKI